VPVSWIRETPISAAKPHYFEEFLVTFSNTTPLFAFAAIEAFDLLQAVHGQLHIVQSVVDECEAGGPITVPDLHNLDWISIIPAPVQPDPRFYMLDAGERDTISSALSYANARVLIDERLGRNLAEYHGLDVVGSLGTLLKAHQLKLIPHFLPVVRELQAKGFHYHEPLVQRLGKLAGE
jgi:predicted nucleic acid-binding protein